jgi:hypothetical protein
MFCICRVTLVKIKEVLKKKKKRAGGNRGGGEVNATDF